MDMSTEEWINDLQRDAERKIRDGEDPRTATQDLVRAICERIEEAESKELEVKIEELQAKLNCAVEDLEQTNAENTRLEVVVAEFKEASKDGTATRLAVLTTENERLRERLSETREASDKWLLELHKERQEKIKLEKEIKGYERRAERHEALQASVEESRNLPPRRLYLGKLADIKKLPAGTRVEKVGTGVILELDDPKTYACHRTNDGREGKLDEAIKGHLFVPTASGFATYDKLNQILSVYKITQPGVES